jgi:divalent metal cation (Fe/Co/Zn/Cd) transporter
VAFAVLGLAFVLESLSLRTAAHEANKLRGSRGWWRFIRSTKNPELPVVLLEDFGALSGLVIAAAGVGLATATDEPAFDAIASITIGILLAVIAFVLAREMKSLLLGEAASPEEQELIRIAIESGPEVERLIHLRTEHLGPDDILVAAKVDLGPKGDEHPARAIDLVEERIRAKVPAAKVIYIEPDEFESKRAPY